MQCSPDWRCYALGALPDCSPLCWGALPFCDHRTLRCVACLTDGDCGAGTICVTPNQRCLAGCSAAHPTCATAAERCDADLGACHGCTSDGDCTDHDAPRCDVGSGRCVACVAESDDCPFGKYCGTVSGAPACIDGCKGPGDCGDSPDGGLSDGGAGGSGGCCQHRCVTIGTDANNCGGCGITCGNGQVCCAGLCAVLASDLDNCGACGNSCDLPHLGGPACRAALCTNTGCESFFADCDRNPLNGCEVNLTQDPNNCYGCGTKCPAPPHAQPGCSVSGCGVGACDIGWANCDKSPGNGCEYDTNGFVGDVNNCGVCGKVCGGNQSCITGQCR